MAAEREGAVVRPLVILANAPCYRDDLAMLDRLGVPFDVCMVNRTPLHCDRRFQFWVSLHGDEMLEWIRAYQARAWCRLPVSCYAYVPPEALAKWPSEDVAVLDKALPLKGGSSAYLGWIAGRELGYERIVLAGVMLTGHEVLENDGRRTRLQPTPYESYRLAWEELAKRSEGRLLRACNGWPRTVFGPPTREWLDGGDE